MARLTCFLGQWPFGVTFLHGPLAEVFETRMGRLIRANKFLDRTNNGNHDRLLGYLGFVRT